MRKILFIFLLLVFSLSMKAQQRNVIIDTDGGIDDFRAVSMLIAVKEVNIKAIVTTAGVLDASETARRVCCLLHYYGKADIPVYEGYSNSNLKPSFRKTAEKVQWGNDTLVFPPAAAFPDNLPQLLSGLSDITYIAMAPLSSLNILLNSNSAKNKISKIIWYAEKTINFEGFNYESDISAASNLFQAGKEMHIVTAGRQFRYSFGFLDSISEINNRYGKAFKKAHYYVMNSAAYIAPHLFAWDDFLPVYFLFTELFDIKPDMKNPNLKTVTIPDFEPVKMAVYDIFNQTYSLNRTIVYNAFPYQKEFLSYDLRIIADSIIKRYGYAEWRACLLTNEIHGHLGVYSLIGAKMGIKARELLDAPVDKISIVSYAGSKTPLSCFNDGLQVSTGATLGQGLITLSDEPLKRPEAVFTYREKSLALKLKDEYLAIIENDMKKGILEYGLLTDGYWKMVRRLAIRYWLEFDREEIFGVSEH